MLWKTSLLRRLPHLSVPVEVGQSIIDVPHVVFGNWILAPCNTHNHVPRPRDRSVVARFRYKHSFYEVNITSFRTQWTPVPVAKWLQAIVDGKAAPAIYTVHSTAPAYQNNRVIVSARDATATTYVADAFFYKFCVIVTLVPVMLLTHLCGTDPVAKPIVLECQDRGMCDTTSSSGCVCNETFRGPGCNMRSCPHCPLHSSSLAENTDFDSESTCKCTSPWTGPRSGRVYRNNGRV